MNPAVFQCLKAMLLADEVDEMFGDESDAAEGSPKTRGRTRKWIKRRFHHGETHNLRSELLLGDEVSYKRWLRMDDSCFSFVLDLINAEITKKNTNCGPPISAAERLTITLRFLATGMSFRDLSCCFRVGERTISYIVMDTCKALYKHLKYTFNMPKSPEDWQVIARGFEESWNFPQCLGAIDGKHIVLKKPNLSGFHYHNYKATDSVVLLAVVDYNYRFMYADVGTKGRISDGGVLAKCNLTTMLDTSQLNLPQPSALRGRQQAIPYVFVADDAFGFKPFVMKSYPRTHNDLASRTFNYRLARARRMLESTFGILANRFRVFLNPIALDPQKVQHIALACCALHNILRLRGDTGTAGLFDQDNIESGTVEPGTWRSDVRPTNTYLSLSTYSSNTSDLAEAVRCEYRDYFVSEIGRVHWQDRFL